MPAMHSMPMTHHFYKLQVAGNALGHSDIDILITTTVSEFNTPELLRVGKGW
jgi:hypothetical protein